jgi:hypothetical protein
MKSASVYSRSKLFWVLFLALALVLPSALATSSFAADPPKVLVMPSGDTATSAYTWAGNSLTIWGKVYWGSSTSGTYSWDINNSVPAEYSGAVSNAKNIAVTHTYAVAGLYEAKLTVTDANGLSDSAIVRILVLPAVTKAARIELAIERGLKWLYQRQLDLGGGGSIHWVNSYSSAGAETAQAVLAFENRGHRPSTSNVPAVRTAWERGNIYAETVHKGLDYAISTLATSGVAAQFDSNANGLRVADNYGDRQPYKIGMYMMALVGAGDVASGAPDLVATTGPAGIVGKTYRELAGDMIDFCDYAQYSGSGGTYGGWRYNPGDWPDNSAAQWCAIGADAAEMVWGVPVRAKIIDSNAGWTSYSQAADGRFGYTTPNDQGTGGYAALTGAGIGQIGFQGRVKTDPQIVAAGNYLKNTPSQRGTGNTYYMYAVAKGARIAKLGGAYSEIEELGSAPGWNWYNEYSQWLIDNQNANGGWYVWGYTYAVLDTAFAVEILTKNVFTLRPIADITASPNPTPPNSPVNFDISGSFHQNSAKVLVSWQIDVDNDGTYDLSGTFPVAGPILYAAGYPDTGGTHNVTAKLRISDNSTPAEYAEKLLIIQVNTGHVPPVAVPGGPYKGVIGAPITFDGSGSFSPNAGPPLNLTIVKYEWDLDGNGTHETNGGSSPTVQKTWTAPYSGYIGLKVTDSLGATATSTVLTQVFVVDLRPENYAKVSEKRINMFVYEYEYKFDMRNIGTADAENVKCTLDSWPAQVSVVDGQVTFGAIAAGAVKTSADTFKIRMDRRYPVANAQLKWKLEYDDAGGSHWIFVNFPL